MKKDITHRIAYYVRKVNERMSFHPSKKLPAKYTYRHERLMAYKKRMFELIEEGEYKKCSD
ncbi:hypothetical protein [Bacillus sp. 1NLA3E]|uniref:hypothetical protein n=1 Tax=Bacillus sp. 1NLA3E TaxID=666686 RepID=UPI000247E673|nr:hypothetical protein [Bacillus sp. 1NLA3E]AGK52002.1 hypothetical protein B1NLA3E_01090 [Bacillus sp. 1NLA3E]